MDDNIYIYSTKYYHISYLYIVCICTYRIVTFEELAEMVEWVWTMYAPGGLLLSKQEQKETNRWGGEEGEGEL